MASSTLIEYLSGQSPHPELPLDVRATAFQWRVWRQLRAIPYGETRTYSAVDLMPYYQQKYMPVFQACLKTIEHPDTSNFAFVVTIGADGHVLRIYIDNETTLFACVRPTLEKEQFPHPPFAPYYMNISMQFSK